VLLKRTAGENIGEVADESREMKVVSLSSVENSPTKAENERDVVEFGRKSRRQKQKMRDLWLSLTKSRRQKQKMREMSWSLDGKLADKSRKREICG